MPSLLILGDVATLAAALGSGLVAGLCFTFASFLMRSFDDLGAPQAIRAMQALNARILRSSAMGVWFGTLVVGIVAAVLAEDSARVGGLVEARTLVIAATALYGVGALAITGRGNVPLNEALDLVDPDAPGAEQAWQRYRVRWGRWNAVRTVVCALASAGFALAL